MTPVRLLASATAALRRDGPGGLLRRLWRYPRYLRAQRAIDRRYGTETLGWVTLDRFTVADPSRHEAYVYGPVTALQFTEVIGALPIIRGDYVFIDIGCGKGLPMMLAAEQGFGEVIGADLEPTLCAQARANLARFRERFAGAPPMRVIEQDATAFAFPSEPTVLFLNNPFGPEVMARLIGNLGASLAAAPRPCWLVYFRPLHRAVADAAPFLRLHAEQRGSSEGDYAVYAAT